MAKAKLVIPTALETANILIMGQITLIYSNVLFQLASVPLRKLVQVEGQGAFILAFVLAVPPILLINIISCWVSTRATFEEFEQYPNSLFMLDTFLLVLFFFINNLISFSVSPAQVTDHLAAIVTNSPVGAGGGGGRLAQSLPPFLYFVSGTVCLLYIAWNRQHEHERCNIDPAYCASPNMVAHNRFLLFASFLQFAIGVYSALSSDVASEGACLFAWAIIWGWLNTQWLITSPLSVASQSEITPSAQPTSRTPETDERTG